MVYQDKYGTVREVKKWGCYMADYINAHTLQTGIQYSQLDLNEFYYKALDAGIIEPNCFINSAYHFCTKILRWNISDIKKVSNRYMPAKNEIVILLMRRLDPDSPEAEPDGYVYHFVLKTSAGIIDPIETGSLTAAHGEVHTMRIIVLREKSKLWRTV
jgi:hypothetical protein